MSSVNVSFEFFPPKTDAMEQTLWASVEKLAPLDPAFVSVTYGAGGSTRERTHRTVSRLVQETGLPVAAHLTTVAASREDIDAVLRAYWAAGVRHIVALRGDPPGGLGAAYEPHPDGYANAAALTEAARRVGDFEVTVGCYPETHPESANREADIDWLKQKVDAGATRAITQFFFDNNVYERYVDDVRRAGIDIPIVPGIMPVGSYKALSRMAGLCGATIPPTIKDCFEDLDNDPETRRLAAVTTVADQCRDLVRRGVEDLHFYTLNRADIAYAVCHLLGIRPTHADGRTS
ncbi:5,10-methylenetetrahydrofolate reductase [Parvularcula bermudensis HTCC2503]|uniref:Methylenetetrahydrofolate reductase n=1 Tax=Parvularcula bermudensis (strain ATCC BAA-594 / HTCC2503 / KCTC 12087) TaxID=314260 RepID=E0TCA7_PARBH|nr:methylenetetrahydrofolate reductase [NAD(P)H] [Parvularcula bermudensis]ADM08540.1 5,10-methylenetetrahydrofolate reductase [Parvularcula bermudensis HTCC2503]